MAPKTHKMVKLYHSEVNYRTCNSLITEIWRYITLQMDSQCTFHAYLIVPVVYSLSPKYCHSCIASMLDTYKVFLCHPGLSRCVFR